MLNTLSRVCAYCTKSFPIKGPKDRKKYCNRSCSTSANNLASPRKVLTKSCANCDTKIGSQLKYCKDCREAKAILNLTIGEVIGNAKYQVNSQLRQIARMTYKASGLPYVCMNCEYDKHVDICHVKDLHQFSPEQLVSETVAEGNLIPLCKNCHWEYDNGYLGVYLKQKPVKKNNQGNPAWFELAQKGTITHLVFNTMEKYPRRESNSHRPLR